jgi:hypothetical protein
MQNKLKLSAIALILLLQVAASAQQKAPAQVWSAQKAKTW